MAAKKINKSELIREAHKAKPDAKPAELVEVLAAKKIKVSAQLISNVLSRVDGAGKKKKKPGRKPGFKSAKGHGLNGTVEAIRLARQFADSVGGTEAATEILAALGK